MDYNIVNACEIGGDLEQPKMRNPSEEGKKQECYICNKWYCRVNRHLRDVHKIKLDGGNNNSSSSSDDNEIKSAVKTDLVGGGAVDGIGNNAAATGEHKKNEIEHKKSSSKEIINDTQPISKAGKRNASAILLGEDLLPSKGGRTVAEYNTAQLLVDLSPNKLNELSTEYNTAQLLVDLSPSKLKGKPKEADSSLDNAKSNVNRKTVNRNSNKGSQVPNSSSLS
jgi:hypothetical protein